MDQQTKAAHALLSAVVFRAIMDTFLPPAKSKNGLVIDSNALTALQFLFATKNYYMEVLDIDTGNFQKSMMARMYSDAPSVHFTDFQRKMFRTNWRLWSQLKAGEAIGQDRIRAKN